MLETWTSLILARRTRRVAALLMGLVFLVLLLGYFTGRRFPCRAGGVPPLRRVPMRIVPGVYLLGGLAPSAAYAVDTSEGLVLIDAGLQSDAGLLKSELAELGLNWRRMRAILITHVHADHCGGAESLRGATGARVYAGDGDAAILRAGTPRVAFFSIFHMPHDAPHPTTIDVALNGGETLTFGDVRIQCISAPGHTPGTTCYLLERQGLRVLFAGDVIMMLAGDENTTLPLRKRLGTYSPYLPPRYRGSARDMLASLRKLRAMEAPDLVLPGHPASDVLPQSPCFTQDRWTALMDVGIREMEVLLARFEADGADFLDAAPKRLLADLYYLGDFQGTAVYGFFASSRWFLVNAPGGPGLAGFVKAGLRGLGREPIAPAGVLLTSCDPDSTAGLNELIATWHPQVAAAPEGLARLRQRCASGTVLLSSEDLPRASWPAIVSIPVAGRGLAQAAYQVQLAGHSVLFTGRIPLKINPRVSESLTVDFLNGQADVHAYVVSLQKLQQQQPQLWLPALPVEGQNANLYDKDWQQTLQDNLQVSKYALSRAQGR